MRLALILLLSSNALVAGADEYQTQIKAKISSRDLRKSCKEKVFKTEFEAFTVRSGTTYVRRPISSELFGFMRSSAVTLDVSPDMVTCSEAAANTGHNTFIIDQGACLATNITPPVACAGGHQAVVYSAQTLLSPDPGIPASAIRGLRVSMSDATPKLKLTVSFQDTSPNPELYNYMLAFDGQTEEVVDGSEILTEVSSCVGLTFALTPYFQGEVWGTVVTYQLPASGMVPLDVNEAALVIIPEGANSTLSWAGVVAADLCSTVIGYDVQLLASTRDLQTKLTLTFPADQTEYILTCEEGSDFEAMELCVKTAEGVRDPPCFLHQDPNNLYFFLGYVAPGVSKYFDVLLGTCLIIPRATPDDAKSTCESYGGQPLGREQLVKGVESDLRDYGAWMALAYDNATSEWRWEDGVVMSPTDPLWAPGYGGPPQGAGVPYHQFRPPGIILVDPIRASSACFL